MSASCKPRRGLARHLHTVATLRGSQGGASGVWLVRARRAAAVLHITKRGAALHSHQAFVCTLAAGLARRSTMAGAAPLEELQAAVDAADLGGVLRALWHHPNRQQRGFEQLARQALDDLAQRVVAGKLPLPHGTPGARQLLALIRGSLWWGAHDAAAAFAAFAGTDEAPQLSLDQWRELLNSALRCAVRQQLPAIRHIAAGCNAAAAQVGQPALPAEVTPPSVPRQGSSAILAALCRRTDAGLFEELDKVGTLPCKWPLIAPAAAGCCAACHPHVCWCLAADAVRLLSPAHPSRPNPIQPDPAK